MRYLASALRLACILASSLAAASTARAVDEAPPLPPTLSDTGLYLPASTTEVCPDKLPFAPQYPLWSDGSGKRRWIQLPAGSAIDATDPDAWVFPVGTRLWKEFSVGRRIETRYIERLENGSWRFATYVWNADETEAVLAPEDGAVVAAPGAPGGRYLVPGRNDCLACHEGGAAPVLGFSALQLSPDRDPLAPHAERVGSAHANLRSLAARGLIVNLPVALLATPPRIQAPTPTARAALGYLHGNCGHCHNDAGALVGLEMVLAQRTADGARGAARVIETLLGQASRFRPHGARDSARIAQDGTGTNMLTLRMRSANPLARMPPLGVQVVDGEGANLVERWITQELQSPGDRP